jgi:pimeloyl-ACP methyl ester carboxylesterase
LSQRRVRSGDVELAVFEAGDEQAETVVLVHGWPDTHHLWDQVVPLLADRFHVVSFDLPGFGASSDPGKLSAFTVDRLANDLRAVLDAVSPERPVHLVGHDWGSIMSWEAVSRDWGTDRIASFTSISGPSLDHLSALLRLRLRRPTPASLALPLAQLASSSYTLFFQLPVLPAVALRALTRERWQRLLSRVEHMPATRIRLAETFRRDAVSGLRLYRANIAPRMWRPRPRRTDVPVLLLVNRADRAIRPGVFDEEHRWVTNLWRRDLPAGHWVAFSHPEVVAAAVRAFADVVAGRPTAERELAELGIA